MKGTKKRNYGKVQESHSTVGGNKFYDLLDQLSQINLEELSSIVGKVVIMFGETSMRNMIKHMN
jgi:hypothetical protein